MSRDVAGGEPPRKEALASEIERTRQELGETVEALAAKADVKARAQRRAAELAGNVRGTGQALKGKVSEQAGKVSEQAGKVSGEVAAKAEGAKDAALATSTPVRGAAAAAVVGALILAWLAIRLLRR
jgi:uncharacterized protein YjbJ (UPF0337 family)